MAGVMDFLLGNGSGSETKEEPKKATGTGNFMMDTLLNMVGISPADLEAYGPMALDALKLVITIDKRLAAIEAKLGIIQDLQPEGQNNEQ